MTDPIKDECYVVPGPAGPPKHHYVSFQPELRVTEDGKVEASCGEFDVRTETKVVLDFKVSAETEEEAVEILKREFIIWLVKEEGE